MTSATTSTPVAFIIVPDSDEDPPQTTQQPRARRVSHCDSDSDSEIELIGYKRQEMPAFKQEELDAMGLAYMGFHAPRKSRLTNSRKPAPARLGSEIIVISSDEDEPQPTHPQVAEGPPTKKIKVSESESIPIYDAPAGPSCLSVRKRENDEATVPMQVIQNLNASRCAIEDSEDFVTSALDPDISQNWVHTAEIQGVHLQVDEDDERSTGGIALSLAALALREEATSCLTNHTATQQAQRMLFDWPQDVHMSGTPHYYVKCQEAIQSARQLPRQTWTSHHLHYGSCGRRAGCPIPTNTQFLRLIHQAPGDLNTVIQSGSIVISASAVADGALNDIPGPFNREGSLSIWDQSVRILREGKGHCAAALRPPVYPQFHYFTVNDIAVDPMNPTRFASAGRDNKVFIWEYNPLREEQRPSQKMTCKANPEVVKYKPGESTLAVQCNDGSVCILRHGKLSATLEVAPTTEGHITADMHWGSGPTQRYLFASSACANDGTGYHKAFDIGRRQEVMKFEAGGQACSTLTLDPFGETLYIATEGPQYILRRYDVRRQGNGRETEKIALEPFPGNLDRTFTDINCLSVSSDGMYIAAGRTDNWLDVYDTRMFRRGPLYKLAHEDREGDVRTAADTYGVVNVQWVDGVPYGTGFVSGGVDGCIRLWDVKLSSEDPYNGRVLVRCDDDVAAFTLGDMYAGEAPIVVGERSGKVSMFGFAQS